MMMSHASFEKLKENISKERKIIEELNKLLDALKNSKNINYCFI